MMTPIVTSQDWFCAGAASGLIFSGLVLILAAVAKSEEKIKEPRPSAPTGPTIVFVNRDTVRHVPDEASNSVVWVTVPAGKTVQDCITAVRL